MVCSVLTTLHTNQNIASVDQFSMAEKDDLSGLLKSLSLTSDTKKAPQGQNFVNGEFSGPSRMVKDTKVPPLVKPQRKDNSQSGTISLSVSSSMFSESLRKRPSSPVRKTNKLELAPTGAFGGADDLLDPKSDAWSKPIDIRNLQISMANQAKTPLTNIHSRSTFGSAPARGALARPNQQFVVETLTAADQAKLLHELMEGGANDESDSQEQLIIKGLEPTLMPHQVVGVKFMHKRELKSKAKGGLLCDDMGLGKTVQGIALILYNPPEDKSGPHTTLIACPVSLMDQWATEIRTKASSLKCMKYHGAGRTSNFKDYDVVITTYNTIVAEYAKGDPLAQGPLLTHKWYRIIADEAHAMRNLKSQTASAMNDIQSDGKRWAFTGTPVHNSIDDLFSLFRFTRVYNDYAKWTENIRVPIEGRGDGYDRAVKAVRAYMRAAMIQRKQEILAKVLPKRTREFVHVTLTETEIQAIEYLKKKVYHYLALLQRLRQACDGIFRMGKAHQDNKDFLESMKTSAKEFETDSELKSEQNDLFDEVDLLSAAFGRTSIEDTPDASREYRGSKMRALEKVLLKEPERKTVVFTSFVSAFPQITEMLDEEGLGWLTYYGGMSTHERDLTLRNFRENDDIKVLICSLQCAAVGLNIVCASRVVILEPWWNPMISEQAINRVYRLGQTKDVDVYEFMANDSVEERIVAVQERKRKLANDVTTRDQMKLTKEDLLYILYGDDIPAHALMNGGG